MQAELLRRHLIIAFRVVPCAKDGFAFGIAYRCLIRTLRHRSRGGFEKRLRKIFRQDLPGFTQHHRTLDCVFCEAPIRFIIEETPEAAGLPKIEDDPPQQAGEPGQGARA